MSKTKGRKECSVKSMPNCEEIDSKEVKRELDSRLEKLNKTLGEIKEAKNVPQDLMNLEVSL